jgi:hypothetical protein
MLLSLGHLVIEFEHLKGNLLVVDTKFFPVDHPVSAGIDPLQRLRGLPDHTTKSTISELLLSAKK